MAHNNRAISYCITLGKNIGLAEVTIKNEEDKLLAHGTLTVMVKPPLKHLGAAKLPSKFIVSNLLYRTSIFYIPTKKKIGLL